MSLLKRALRSSWLAIGVAMLFLSVGACAQDYASDHLVPESSSVNDSYVSAGYDELVRKAFADAFDRDVKVRLLVEPSFSPESVIALSDANGKYRVLALKASTSLWALASDMKEKSSQATDLSNVKVTRCEAAIDESLARRIIATWNSVLLETRFLQPDEDGVIPTDGDAYHFWGRGELGELSGVALGGIMRSKPSSLTDVASAMSNYCEKHNPEALSNLTGWVSVLEQYFKPDKQQ